MMRRFFVGIAILWPSLLYASDQISYSRAIDGDTLFALVNGQPVTIRLWGIDAPERQQPFGVEAHRRLEVFLGHCPCVGIGPSRSPTLATNPLMAKDRYGRMVMQLASPVVADVGEQLLTEGLAWWASQYAPKATRYALAQSQAQHAQCGLWRDKASLPPWRWRRRGVPMTQGVVHGYESR